MIKNIFSCLTLGFCLLSLSACIVKTKDRTANANDGTPKVAVANLKAVGTDHIAVYKYDGSKQCGMGKPISTADMAKELAGIKIISSTNKSDGMMRTQVCGAGTGAANIYVINKSDLEKAKKLKFLPWTF